MIKTFCSWTKLVYYSYFLSVFPRLHAITDIRYYWKVQNISSTQCVQWVLKWVTDIKRECLRLSLSTSTWSQNQLNKHLEEPQLKSPRNQKYICGKEMTTTETFNVLWKDEAYYTMETSEAGYSETGRKHYYVGLNFSFTVGSRDLLLLQYPKQIISWQPFSSISAMWHNSRGQMAEQIVLLTIYDYLDPQSQSGLVFPFLFCFVFSPVCFKSIMSNSFWNFSFCNLWSYNNISPMSFTFLCFS